ncbi:homeobox and leucine zipper encoding b [Chelmon rostratus]|uniref:homeobox and leucine zipper encoding b n=1 Tax=Chelmon rostratus TaxID=109905 RepID=UPI001BECFC32|nr:homeobox and leucine zipper encoding b [Chelmon rostratus]
MRQMRQTSVGGLHRLMQKTPDAGGETPNLAPAPFNLNQSSAVCLPLVSDSKRLIWIHSNQINLQLDVAAELDKAFDRFPYLTQNQTAALAQCCSLHPDQVKVWFMVQRLRYGISWDYEDILNVQRKLFTSRGTEELKSDRRKENKWKREVKESGRKEAGEVRREQSANEGRMMGENVRANEPLEIKSKQEQPVKYRCVELEKDQRKKWKRMTATGTMGGKKRSVDEGVMESAGEAEITSDEVEMKSTRSKPTQSKTTHFTRKTNKRLIQEWPARKSFVVPDEVLDASSPVQLIHMTQIEKKVEGKLCAESTNPSGALTDGGKLKKLEEGADNPVVAQIRSSTKKQSQLVMMRAAFLECQYPDSEGYNQLAMLIGVSRGVLVQWFSDMRYYIKKVIPRWMNQEQHRRVLANIKYRQNLNELAKSCRGGGKAT